MVCLRDDLMPPLPCPFGVRSLSHAQIKPKGPWLSAPDAADEVGMSIERAESIARLAGVPTEVVEENGQRYHVLSRDAWETAWCRAHEMPTGLPGLRFEYVYFVGAPDVAKVKIGTTHRDPRWRFLRIQATSPIEVMQVGCLLGGARHEASVHKVFKEYRCHAEWFRCKGKLLDFIINHIDEWMVGESDQFVTHQYAYFERMHTVWEERLFALVGILDANCVP
jgi:hypothetical protein